MADANVSGDAGRPDPAKATTPAEFVEAMRGLKRWTGFGLRRLEKRAATGGHSLPRSTLTVALSRATVPRAELVAAFAHACGCDEDETARWVAAARRVAAAGVPETTPEPAPETAPALEAAPAQEKPTAPPPPRRRLRRLVPALLALAAVATVITFLLGSSGGPPGGSRQGADDPGGPAPTSPGSSRTRTSGPPPESPTVITPGGGSVPTTADDPGVLEPIGLDTPAPTEQPGAPRPPGPPSPGGTVPPAPEQSDRATMPVEGEDPVRCPMPFIVNDVYGALAQCTQQSGDQARIGYYSFVTGKFSPAVGWVDVVEARWYEGTVVATDGVEGKARGYAVVATDYGAGVFATQYRDGEARWGTINLMDHKFRPAAQGWQRLPD